MTNASTGGKSPLKRTGWSTPVKLGDALDGKPPPGPEIGRWTDVDDQGRSIRRALFYPNEVHSVFGEPESMKSWLLLMAAVQEIKLGQHVFYVDMEANDRSIVGRLVLLGASREQIKQFFHYYRPDERINDADRRRFKSSVKKSKPTLVVLDGVTEAYALHGLSVNSSEDSAQWFGNFARQFAVESPSDEYVGPAIVELDHVVKDREGRGSWALGSQHKKAGIKGSAYQVVPVRPFGKGKHGISRLFLEKDSPGGVEWMAFGKDRRRLVAELHCDASDGEGVDAYIESPSEDDSRLPLDDLPASQTLPFRQRMHGVWKFLKDNPGATGRLIRNNVKGSPNDVSAALEQLRADGYVENQGTTTRGAFVAVGEYDPLRPVPRGGVDGD